MSQFPSRPHLSPCACELCQEWARTVVATPTERKPVPPPSCIDRAEMPMESFMRGIIAAACKATGLTEEQLRKRGKEIESEIPEVPVARTSRETVAARGVPEGHLIAIYDNEPKTCQAFSAVSALVAGPKTMLVISGGIGTRKSGSACWALTKKPGRYIKAARLAALASSSTDEDRALYSSMFRCQLLILDDIGGEYEDSKGYFAKLFNELMDERYERRLLTIVTTNVTAARFRTAYGDRVLDRILEVGDWVDIAGASMRTPIAGAA